MHFTTSTVFGTKSILNGDIIHLFRRCRGTKSTQKLAPWATLVTELVLQRWKWMHPRTAFFALQSWRVHVCWWIRLPLSPWQLFLKIGVCPLTCGWDVLSLKKHGPTRDWAAYGLHEGSRLSRCVSPRRERYVLTTYVDCCFRACPSPPEYQTEEAQDRRRGLLTEVCSQERAISLRKGTWSVFSFSELKVIANSLAFFFSFFLFP